MDDPVIKVEFRAKALQDQIFAWQSLMSSEAGAGAIRSGTVDPQKVLAPLFDKLRRLYVEDLPMAKLRQNSDLIIHAEGPSTNGDAPQLRAVNWIGRTVRAQFTKLAAAALPVSDSIALNIAKQAEWGITGLVPGSIYMGFALERPHSPLGFEISDQHAFDLIVEAARSISIVPQFIKSDGVNSDLTEAISDPALRDAAMMAALQLSPTKKSTFETVEIFAPGGANGKLHHRERVALQQALISPMMKKKQFGEFVGELNEVDLDSSRFQVRNIAGVGTLRCFMDFTAVHARHWLGQKIRVSGIYDTDKSGRPRLMRVQEIKILEEQPLL